MNRPLPASRCVCGILLLAAGFAGASTGQLQWSRLPDIPDKLGVAAPFAGVSHDWLLVAGGANFPSGMPWEGGKKAWHDRIWALDLKNSSAGWRDAGKLPRPLAYGVSLTVGDGVFCAGGSDAGRHYAETFSLDRSGDSIVVRPGPALPVPLAHASGAVLKDGTVIIVGGAEKPGEQEASGRAFAIKPADAAPGWKELPPLPGKPRLMPVVGVDGLAVLVFGGVALEPDAAGKIRRVYLKDAWRYSQENGWTQLADAPKPAAAAASPAPVIDGEMLVMAGDDGSLAGFAPPEKHPGFPARILAFRLADNSWREAGTVPAPRATVPLVALPDGRLIFPSGEVRPGVRSPEVWMLSPSHKP